MYSSKSIRVPSDATNVRSRSSFRDVGDIDISVNESKTNYEDEFLEYCRTNGILTTPKPDPKPETFDFETGGAKISFVNGTASRIRLNTEEEVRVDPYGEPSSSFKETIDERLDQLMTTMKSTCIPCAGKISVETPVDRYRMQKLKKK